MNNINQEISYGSSGFLVAEKAENWLKRRDEPARS